MITVKGFCSLIYLWLALGTLTNAVYGQICLALRREPWSYAGVNGPQYWGLSFEACSGYNQSPIRINSTVALQDENLDKLTFNNYKQSITKGTIENNGHTIEVTPEDEISRTIFVNGNEYSLRQFNCHWGSYSFKGSEHIVDGTQYAMEMQLVHLNSYGDIAIVALLFKEQEKDNDELQKIVDQFSDVEYKGVEAELASEINLNNILPENPASFYRYQGSLTRPGCAEGVTWSVLRNHVMVGKAQMRKFRRHLYSVTKEEATKNCKLVNNYRPTQPLNGRKVHTSQ